MVNRVKSKPVYSQWITRFTPVDGEPQRKKNVLVDCLVGAKFVGGELQCLVGHLST